VYVALFRAPLFFQRVCDACEARRECCERHAAARLAMRLPLYAAYCFAAHVLFTRHFDTLAAAAAIIRALKDVRAFAAEARRAKATCYATLPCRLLLARPPVTLEPKVCAPASSGGLKMCKRVYRVV